MKKTIKTKLALIVIACIILSIVLGVLIAKAVNSSKPDAYKDMKNVTWLVSFDEKYEELSVFTNKVGEQRFLGKREVSEDEYVYDILDKEYHKQNTIDGKYDLNCYPNFPYLVSYDSKGLFKESGVGLMDEDGHILLKPEYEDFTSSTDGFFAAVKEDKDNQCYSFTFYDINMNKVGELTNETYTVSIHDVYSNIGNGLFAFDIQRDVDDKGVVIYDIKRGEIIKKLKTLSWIKKLSDDIYCGFADTADDIRVYDPSYQGDEADKDLIFDKDFNFVRVSEIDYSDAQPFSEGLSFASGRNQKYKLACIDEKFNIVFETEASLGSNQFSEGKAILYNEDNFFCVDKSGKQLYKKERKGDRKNFIYTEAEYKNGKAIVQDDKKFGIVDEKGEWIVDPIFTDITYIADDTYIVNSNYLSAAVMRIDR